ncbi:lysine exporter LysO family protein [Geovibrio thiophilus]|uniref:Lysine exporter LysO family protein n=1 Tax=Geovibrio thiophilus TaxID=139438 RepID=A0A410JUJ4_9BACT|nr:lysine exporter LysO family protein [Geovibrio thiophilus]QAR31864.1 lysine exporter LysO family protein [Geovibrio thiophilus]
MLIILIVSVVTGAFLSFNGLLPEVLVNNNGLLVEAMLYLMLFLIGFDLGTSRAGLKATLKPDRYLIIVPAGTIAGTIFGGFLCSFVIDLSAMDSMAVASGFGWYSFSAVILAKVKSAELGAIAFLSNVIRESLTLVSVPFIAKYFGQYAAIAPGGATTMDVTLPVIEKFAGRRAALIGFVQGVLLTGLTPFIIQLFI